MCLNAALGSPTAKIVNATQVVKINIVTKKIFILRIKILIYFFNSCLNLNKFIVKKIWADISEKINKIIINRLILLNKFESKFIPRKAANFTFSYFFYVLFFSLIPFFFVLYAFLGIPY